MTSYSETDLINSFLYNNKIDSEYTVTTKNLYNYFHYVIKDVPSEYINIKRGLSFIRSNYKNSIKWSSPVYYAYIASVFIEIENRNIKLPRGLFTYIKNNRYNFGMVHDLMDYFVTVFLPDRLDLLEINNIKIDCIARFYQRVGFNVILTNKAGFNNPNEIEIYDVINNYEYHGTYSLRATLIGFYYINHNRCNLSIESLIYALNNFDNLYTKMVLNDLEFNNLDDKLLLNFFRKDNNKIMIK